MAATPFDAAVPTSSFLFDIYNDGGPPVAAPRNAPNNLPGGPCNFTDLTAGANGARCGCRRFWSRPVAPARTGYKDPDEGAWCMCSHHACFHEEVQPGQALPALLPPLDNQVPGAGQENERPRITNREPLSPVQGLTSFAMPSSLGTTLDLDLLNFPSTSSFSGSMAITQNHATAAATQVQVDTTIVQAQDASMPDTLDWANFVQSHNSSTAGEGRATPLPPIPSQCLMPSPGPPSTASSSQARYLRPFGGKGLQTLNSEPISSILRRPSVDVAASYVTNEFVSQRAEDADARPGGSPALVAGKSSALVRAASPDGSLVHGSSRGTDPNREAFQQLSDTVQSHEQRLERLETASFSVAGHDECHEKYDQADLRVTELESRVGEVERILSNDTSTVGSVRRSGRRGDVVDDATASVASVSTNATARATERAEMYDQLQALQAQVNRLQASLTTLPSFTSPWELEVVFLPFPLKGIWFEAYEFKNQRPSAGSNGDEWTQLPNTHSRATPDPQSPQLAEWVGEDLDCDWLLPRACAPGRLIDQRLKSRGLIKTIAVKGSDARSIQTAMVTAFGDALRTLTPSANTASGAMLRKSFLSDPRYASFLGLRQPWVPLRKLHKDSRLRFLAPAEMLTPTLWTATFLASSVVMKSTGLQRLYVTQPEAYLQNHAVGEYAYQNGWSWQRLRELSRVYPDSQASSSSLDASVVPEADAYESYWSWNDRLDDVPVAARQPGSSLNLGQSRRSSTSPSFHTGIQSPILSNSPAAGRQPSPAITAVKDRKAPRPAHIRTNSMPPALPALISPSQSKRRVASYTGAVQHPAASHSKIMPYERRSSPLTSRASPRLPGTTNTAMSSALSLAKRRHGTRSPSLAPKNTPRWSRASMSRSPSLAPFGEHPAERRTTPFAYATPYSNAPPYQQSSRAGSRAPAGGGQGNVYGLDEDDEDMGEEADDEGRGSSTDAYDDDEMTNDADDDLDADRGGQRQRMAYDRDDDGDVDIGIYEDDEDDQDRLSSDAGHGHGQRQGLHIRSRLPEDEPWPGIEDAMSDGENVEPHSSGSASSASASATASQPALGGAHLAAGAGDDVDIEIDDGSRSDVSSQPSEYPSTQRAWHIPASGQGQHERHDLDSIGHDAGDIDLGLSDLDNGSSGAEFKIHEDGDGGEGIHRFNSQWP